jgi:hypothetical protein
MGIAEDLLRLAGRLANPAPTEPEQACLRRSISTAYYALFHLLIHDAVQTWSGSQSARLGLARRFEHKTMKQVSQTVMQGSWKGWSTPPLVLPVELQTVAKMFVELQEDRLQADYDNAKIWVPTDVLAKVDRAGLAFENWAQIRTHPVANEYLLSLLIGAKRE